MSKQLLSRKLKSSDLHLSKQYQDISDAVRPFLSNMTFKNSFEGARIAAAAMQRSYSVSEELRKSIEIANRMALDTSMTHGIAASLKNESKLLSAAFADQKIVNSLVGASQSINRSMQKEALSQIENSLNFSRSASSIMNSETANLVAATLKNTISQKDILKLSQSATYMMTRLNFEEIFNTYAMLSKSLNEEISNETNLDESYELDESEIVSAVKNNNVQSLTLTNKSFLLRRLFVLLFTLIPVLFPQFLPAVISSLPCGQQLTFFIEDVVPNIIKTSSRSEVSKAFDVSSYRKVAIDNLNVRISPRKKNSPIIMVLSKSDTVKVIEKGRHWSCIQLENKKFGYVMTRYLKKVDVHG